MTFEVTQEDIRTGRQGGCCDCPVAKSIRRVFPIAEVDCHYIYPFGMHAAPVIRLPIRIETWVMHFDSCNQFLHNLEPFQFFISAESFVAI